MKFFQRNRQVIFKQRTARHLAVRSNLAWEYEMGNVITCDPHKKIVVVCWLQGHHSRTDDVPYADIVAVNDNRCRMHQIGGWKGRSRLLQEIVEEGHEG